jgi:exonuclease VII small subunit
MSNKTSEALHILIQSLSKAEKRYFKLYASRHTIGNENIYVRLFGAIDVQKKYDEAALRKKFEGEKFLRNFPIAKQRLHDAILKSLDAFHSNSSIEAELKRNLHCAEILYKKSLYHHCGKILARARRLAEKYERQSSLLEIFLWEKRLIEKDNYSGKTVDDLGKFLQEDKLIAEKIKNFNEYWNIKSRLFMILNKKGKARTKEELQSFKGIIDNTLLKAEDKALSIETKYLFHHIYSAYYFGTGDYEKCYDHLRKNVELIESHTNIFEEEPNIYFSVLTNIIYIGSQLKRYDEVFGYLRKLRAVPQTFDISKNEDLEIKLFSSSFSIEITLYNTLAEFERSIELVPKIEEGLRKYAGKINKVREAYFYSSISVAYFGAAKYPAALKWINKLLNDKEIKESEDTHCLARIFKLIIYIELKHDEAIASAYKSTHRYLRHRERVYKFETAFMNFIGKILKDNTVRSRRGFYEKLRDELQVLVNDPFEKTAFEYFDYLSWVEGKIRQLPFRDVMEEKAQAGT